MLRELITWVLNTYLGKYLENFNPAQLTVAILSGEVELENVPLRKDALRGLGLPLQALSGSIGKIKLQVPVRQFRTAPWCISIEKVYIVIGPINLEEWDDEKEEQADLDYKLQQLDDIDAKWRAQREVNLESGYYASSYSGWLSYGSSLATNILENLQLKINDVHIRYEDSISIPHKVFACGITISSLSAQSCDSNWAPGMTNNWGQSVASFKLVELRSFAFYWDRVTNDQVFGSIPPSELADAMQKSCVIAPSRYVFNPVSAQAHFKRDRSETPLRTRSRPRLSCEVTVSEINFSLSDLQYNQMVECVRGLDDLAKFRRYRLLRPRTSIAHNPKAWWRYAAKCHGFDYQSMEDRWEIVRENSRYLKICLKLALDPNENLTEEEKKIRSDIEKKRDFDDLRSLREISLLCVPNDNNMKNQGSNQGRNMLFQWFPQWWGWYGGSAQTPSDAATPMNDTNNSNNLSNLDQLELSDEQTTFEDEILNALAGSVENNSLLKRDAVFGKFDFVLKNGILNICSENVTTCELNTMMEMHFDGLVLNVETRPRSGSHFIGLSLGSVNVKDRITQNTEFPDLIKPQHKEENIVSYGRLQNPKSKKESPATSANGDSSEPLFQLQYERKPLAHNTDYRLAVKTKSLDVVYNVGALRWVIDFVSKPLQILSAKQKIEAMKNRTKLKLMKNWKNMLDGDSVGNHRKSWALEIDVSAPQIIFVEDLANKNTSIVVIDFGRFQLLKNAARNRLRQQASKTEGFSRSTTISKISNRDSEDDDAFMTPCSTPPGSHNSTSDSPTLISAASTDMSDVIINSNTGLEDALHNKLYDKYTIDLTDLQVLVCKGKERWAFASTKATSSLHVLDRFNISLQLERRVVHTVDPQYPSITLYGTLPKLVAHVNEHKILALREILDNFSGENSYKTVAKENLPNPLDFNYDEMPDIDRDQTPIVDEEGGNREASNLMVLQFAIDQMSLEVQSRGRSIAELQVTGVKAGYSKRSVDTNISLSVHGLLLVDAIQSFGPDFELLVASHRHVGMDSVSGSLKHSEPCSPTSPSSPDPLQERRPTSPQTLTNAISSLQRDALITVEILFVSPENNGEKLQIANIHFNNLDIIANQETTVELLGFIKRVFPTRDASIMDDSKATTVNTIQTYPKAQPNLYENQPKCEEVSIRTEITFDFNRLNVLILRALMRDTFLVGRKVGTFTMSEARIHATVGKELTVEGSLGGLQILDLTPEGVNHQRILSVGKDPLTEPPEIERDLLSSLTQEIYGMNQSKTEIVCDLRQALVFKVSRNVQAVVSIKVRMASVWYTHCARFVQELSWCASEFKHYLKNFARSIREKATDMAFVLVQPINNNESGQEDDLKYETKDKHMMTSSFKGTRKKKRSKTIDIRLDVVLDTPVLVVPRSSCSPQVLVAHLGKISIFNVKNNNAPEKREVVDDRKIFTIDEDDLSLPVGGNEFMMDDEEELCRNSSAGQSFDFAHDFADANEEKESDVYSIDVRNMNLFSLDTSSRKGFRLSALPRAEEFYSCHKDAVAILYDTAICLKIVKITEIYNQTVESIYDQKDTLQIKGSVTEPLQLSLSRQQYEQLLETIDNIFKVPADLVRPPTEVDVNQIKPIDEIDIQEETITSAFVLNTTSKLTDKLYPQQSLEKRRDLEPKLAFTLPIFIIQLKNEHNTPMIEISFREFNFNFEKSSTYETNVQVSLRSILMEDLLCPIDSKYRQMVVSSSQDSQKTRHGGSYSSSSCPNLVRLQAKEDDATGSLPDNLEHGAGFEKISQHRPSYIQSHLQPNPLCPETPPPSPQLRAKDEDNLVIYSALIVDPECPGFDTQYNSRRQTSSIDFNSLDLIVSVERWFLLLNFFGLMSDDDVDTNYVRQERDQPLFTESTKENSELEILVRSLTLVFVRTDYELAKANVSNACFVVTKHNISKIVEGRLGSVSLFDLTGYGGIYRERFLTSGTEALNFIYKRDSEKNNQRTLNKDAKLKIQMSSVKYVHTKRFVMEIQEFFKEFLQLQTPVMRRIKSSDARHNLQQRPTQLGLEINAGSPIILLPLSYQSDQVIVADLGEFSLKNSYHLASEQQVISVKSDQSLLDEILDVMQVDLVNTDLFTGLRWSKCYDRTNIENVSDVCLDMGSYWIIKKGTSMLKEKCHLKLQIERNMDSWKSHNCPDFSVQGTLSRLEGILDIAQYKLVRGFLSYNLGEPIDDIYSHNSFSLAESRVNLTNVEHEKLQEKLIWTNMSINLNLENVSVMLNWLVENNSDQLNGNDFNQRVPQSLACINFIKSSLKIDSFSDGSQDIDLVSQEILVTDSRYQSESMPKNVYTNILQPIHMRPGSNSVQAEVHSRKRTDNAKFTILLNNMRLMAIIDWLENVQDYISQNADQPKGAAITQYSMEASNSPVMAATVDTTPTELILNITDSELVFVEKTNQIDTNAIILKSTTVVSYKPTDFKKLMSINLNNLEVFSCTLGCEDETALSIIDPITINLDVKKETLEIQLQQQLFIRLSYHDVKMFTRMLESLPKQTRTAQTNERRKTSLEAEVNEYFVSQLTALGFKELDCIRALEISNHQLDEAAIWLTQNAEVSRTQSARHQASSILDVKVIEVRAHCISICVIDDCKDADVPLLELSFSDLAFRQEVSRSLTQRMGFGFGTPGFSAGHLRSVVASDYYNRHLSGWEPMIEPWPCCLDWNYSWGRGISDRTRLNLNVVGEDLLKFNVTSTLIELWQIVRTNWTQDYYEGSNALVSVSSGGQSPGSGYRRRSPFVPFSLCNQTGTKLWFKTMVTSPGGITRTEVSRDRVRSQWVAVEPNDTVPFSFGEQNKLRHMDSHKLNLHQVVVRVDGWSEVGPVSVDKVGVFFRHSIRETITDYPSMPKARVVFAVTLEGSAQKLVTIRSALKLINRLEDIVLLKLDHPFNYMGIQKWPEAITSIVGPGERFSIPLNHVHASLYFRPLPSLLSSLDEQNGNTNMTKSSTGTLFNGNDYWRLYDSQRQSSVTNTGSFFQFCDRSINWRDCVEGSEIQQEIRTCKSNRSKAFAVVATVRREPYPSKDANILPGHTITLLPPLRINNLLCCDLLYKLSSGTQGRIQSSKTANIFEFNLNDPLELSITLDGYSVAGQLSIPANHMGIMEPKLRLVDVNNRDLQLRTVVVSAKGNGMEISISAPLWIVNRTGLPLVFKQEGVSHDASGQFSENEQARLVSPLMFSFSDPDAMPTIAVRLGKRFGPNPPWCEAFNLHKDVIHRQLKSTTSNETFVIGIEVRRGRGRYSRTSVVTLSPRFQLYNRSSHKLQFAQKFYATTMADPESRSTFIDAVPGCHLPFHWPRLDKDQQLCVRLPDVEECLWSGGIPINQAQSLYVNIRNVHGHMFFLRLEVILQGATYFLLFGDAHALPPPIRLDNYSEVPITFFQPGGKHQWRTVVKPHSSISYALDEPTGNLYLQIEAPGGVAYNYSLRDLESSRNLTYENFIYIAFKGTFRNPATTENLHKSPEFDLESQHLVLGVRDSRVILMRKQPGDRSQLWRMNQEKMLEHEGSSPPTEPGRTPSKLIQRLVLDLERAPQPMFYTSLVVRPANRQRKSTQTWRFTEDGRLMCEHANMCVQSRDGIFGLRPGCDAVLGMITSETHMYADSSVPIEQFIERQKLRPGSGCLSVNVTMDGPITTLCIKDIKSTSNIPLAPDPAWKHASNIIPDFSAATTEAHEKPPFAEECHINVNLERGLGISLVSKRPQEELAYITLEKISMEALSTPCMRMIDLNVGDMQIDNQLLETPCPVLLYKIGGKLKSKAEDPNAKFPALQFNAEMLPTPNANAVIFKRMVLSLRPFAMYLEERLILRLAIFLGFGKSDHDATALADESDFEAQQVATKILAANAKRYYFGDLQIVPCEIRLSVITASKLSPQLSEIKKRLGLPLIKFENAIIDFEKFSDRHHFETLEVYLRAIKSHYKNELKWQAGSILGSVDFLGNPFGFASDLSEGVAGLILEGSVTGLVKSVTHGISNSTAKLTETISDGLGRAVLDEQDNDTRQRILEVPTGAHSSGEHLAAGLKGFGFGLLGGVTSIVKHTYEGAQNEGFQGFISGLGKGIVGTVTKPIIGVLDLASETANAVRETSKSARRILPDRKRLPRCVSGAPGGLLPPFSFTQAKGQQHLFLINKRDFTEQLMSYEPHLFDDRGSKLRLLVSSENLWVFSITEDTSTIILTYHLSELVSCHPVSVNTNWDGQKLKKSRFYIELCLTLSAKSAVTSTGGQEVVKRPRVRCQTEEMAQKASRHINYAKSIYDERIHTLNCDPLLDN